VRIELGRMLVFINGRPEAQDALLKLSLYRICKSLFALGDAEDGLAFRSIYNLPRYVHEDYSRLEPRGITMQTSDTECCSIHCLVPPKDCRISDAGTWLLLKASQSASGMKPRTWRMEPKWLTMSHSLLVRMIVLYLAPHPYLLIFPYLLSYYLIRHLPVDCPL
jgi:hypothetical protein